MLTHRIDKQMLQRPNLTFHAWIYWKGGGLVDVVGDSHYGFRVDAGLRNLIVDDHRMIYYQLHKELIGE